jgi:PAS domain S-box-containing protein
MDSDHIVTKLELLVVLPLISLLLVAFFLYSQLSHGLESLHKTEKNIQKIEKIMQLITTLQKERGLSSAYLETNSTTLFTEIQKQREETDKNRMRYTLKNLSSLRNRIDKHLISSPEEIILYTNIIQNMFNKYIKIVDSIQNKTISGFFAPVTSLTVMQEALGQIRGSLHANLNKDSFNQKLFDLASTAKAQYQLAYKRYNLIAPKQDLQKFTLINSSKEYLWVSREIQNYLNPKHKVIDINSTLWFQEASIVLSDFVSLRELHFKAIQRNLNNQYKEYTNKIFLDISIFLIILFFMLFLGLKIKKSILLNISLLKQYRDIVDRSSIVSKTDIDGKITYVNDKFCDISGYERGELIGQDHNIIRHQDMPRNAFTHLWHTILAKKPWYGIVKNRKKDGSFYTVEATINPILNSDNEIVEFIALRNDITDVVKLQQEIEDTQEDIILRMGEIGEVRSQETGKHVKRVAAYSELLAKCYGLSKTEIKNLTVASPMHDIGKVAIPDTILNKPGKLTKEEWKIMQTHAEIGYHVFKDSPRELLKTAAIIAYEHHEKYDGSGYPRGLVGKNIHIFGRISALADVFDALGSDRCYKKAWDDEKIFKLLKEERGKHFDPKLIDIFFDNLDKFLAIRDKYLETNLFTKESA